MFTTLLESRTPHTRRRGGTTISVLLHGTIVAAGVMLTAHEKGAAAPLEKPPLVTFVPIDPRPRPQQPTQSQPRTPVSPAQQFPRPIDVVITPPTIIPDHLPPITAGPEIPPERIGIGGIATPSGRIGGAINTSGVVDVEYVERAPSVLGQPRPPRYPSLLSQTGTSGQVVVRFVIDTLGRAEMGELTVVESTQALFTDAVKAVLPTYRFTPGEVGGRKVRTLVQMPFSFSVK